MSTCPWKFWGGEGGGTLADGRRGGGGEGNPRAMLPLYDTMLVLKTGSPWMESQPVGDCLGISVRLCLIENIAGCLAATTLFDWK